MTVNLADLGTGLGAISGSALAGAATVPGAASTPSQSSLYMDSLAKTFTENQAKLQEATRQASIPISGGHQAQMPLSLMPQNNQAPYAPLDHRQVVGKHNAKMQGIGNAITGTTNLIAAFKTAEDNKKSKEVASSVQTLMTAQQAMDQAKQVMTQAQQTLQTDPNNAAAKEALEHNTTVANGILDGPHGKAIMKGFDVNYTDPSQNKTPEHGMVQKAIALFKQKQQGSSGGANLENFQKATPTTLAPNVAAQQRVTELKEQQKSQQDIMKSWVPLIQEGDRQTFEAAQTQLRLSEQLKENDLKYRREVDLQRDTQTFEAKQQAARISADFGLARQRSVDLINQTAALQRLASENPDNIVESQMKADHLFSEEIGKQDESRDKVLADLSKPKVDSEAKKTLQAALKTIETNRADLVKAQQGAEVYYEIRKQKALEAQGIKLPGGDSNGGSPANNGGNTSGGTPSTKPPNYNGRGVINKEATKSIDFLNNYLPKGFQIPRPERGEGVSFSGKEPSS